MLTRPAVQHEAGDDVLAYGLPRPSRMDAAAPSSPRTTTAIPAWSPQCGVVVTRHECGTDAVMAPNRACHATRSPHTLLSTGAPKLNTGSEAEHHRQR